MVSAAGSTAAEDCRIVHSNNPGAHEDEQGASNYASNYVSTTKYHLATFVPHNLYEQFHRVANVYFLAVSIMVLTPVTPISPTPIIMGFLFVILATMAREAFDDVRRYASDKEVNSTPTRVVRGGELLHVPWADVRVGDIVRVNRGETFPADLVVLSSSLEGGRCYVDTMSLDGETNLKARVALESTAACDNRRDIALLRCKLKSEHPNHHIHHYTGSLTLLGRDGTELGYSPVSIQQTLLRGCVLRNTSFVFGLVVATGHETKVMLNSTAPPAKMSKLEHTLNVLVFAQIMILLLFALCSAVGGGLYDRDVFQDSWYLHMERSVASEAIKLFFTFVILYYQMVPISLYISVELARLVQSIIMQKDKKMLDDLTGRYLECRSTGLNEELGQVSYVLSDKTGTLTQNVMQFRCCVTNGKVYGTPRTHDATTQQNNEWDDDAEDTDSLMSRSNLQPVDVDDLTGSDRDIRSDLAGSSGAQQAECLREFLLNTALCHTALRDTQSSFESKEDSRNDSRGGSDIPLQEKVEEKDAGSFQASSPDEVALVSAAHHFGVSFVGRTTTSVTVRLARTNTDKTYRLLAVLPFSSERRRMSVIVQEEDASATDPLKNTNPILLYSKGADSTMFSLLKASERQTPRYEAAATAVERFAEAGLRTLVMARKEIERDSFDKWYATYDVAVNSVNDRKTLVAEAAARMERDLELCGATGIEDQLQQGVPETIALLRRANVPVWVVTGDKEATALNIGRSCNVIHEHDEVIILRKPNEDVVQGSPPRSTQNDTGPSGITTIHVAEAGHNAPIDHLRSELEDHLARVQDMAGALDGSPGESSFVLVMGGQTLHECISPFADMRRLLMRLTTKCRGAIFFRASPLQKTEVVEMLREYLPDKITLAIGDGANDVSMIQAAHVGVGIAGKEGTQAVLASDYAFGQFRFLLRLLLWHGRNNYKRMSTLVLYFLYKNLFAATLQFWWSFHTGFSGQTIYDALESTLYNIMFTSFAPVTLAILNFDLYPSTVMQVPELYRGGQLNTAFGARQFAGWTVRGVFHSLLAFWVSVIAVGGVQDVNHSNGKVVGLWALSTQIYTCLILGVNAKIALHIHTWKPFITFMWAISWVLWYVFIFTYSVPVLARLLGAAHMTDIAATTFSTASSWLGQLFVVAVILVVDLGIELVRLTWKPNMEDIVRERAQARLPLDVPRAKSS